MSYLYLSHLLIMLCLLGTYQHIVPAIPSFLFNIFHWLSRFLLLLQSIHTSGSFIHALFSSPSYLSNCSPSHLSAPFALTSGTTSIRGFSQREDGEKIKIVGQIFTKYAFRENYENIRIQSGLTQDFPQKHWELQEDSKYMNILPSIHIHVNPVKT
jgi:hypothetical protein